jgi:hypothetical protein
MSLRLIFAYHRRRPGRIPGQWTDWDRDEFLSQHFSFPCQYHSTTAPYSPSLARYCCQQGKTVKPGNVPKATLCGTTGSTGQTSTLTSHAAQRAAACDTQWDKRTAVCRSSPIYCNHSRDSAKHTDHLVDLTGGRGGGFNVWCYTFWCSPSEAALQPAGYSQPAPPNLNKTVFLALPATTLGRVWFICAMHI